jgi:transposase
VNWVLSLYEVLSPLVKAMWEQLKDTRVLQADDTRVKMLATNKQGFMWCYRGCDPDKTFVIFSYNGSRTGTVPSEHLKDFKGILQTDGYSGFNELRTKPCIISVGCFAHCRRKFVEVIKVSGNATGKANEAVKTIERLYEIEREAKGLSFSERHSLRQEKAKPILEGFKQWLITSSEKVGEKSKLSQAIHYALNQWDYLSAYINHGEVEIDNNWCENQIRPFALGRKNWLFVGNQRGADAAALFYSLIQSCILNNIEPRKYFNYMLKHVKEMRIGTIEAKNLLPQNIDVKKLLD